MSARIAVLVFPGTNSEDETERLLRDCGGDAELVHWSRAESLAGYDAYVLPGGFAHEDRVRAGAIAAHDRMMDFVIEGAARGKMVMGVCNGAQILLEAGLVPGTGSARRPTAAFTFNGPQPHFICRQVYVLLAIEPSRSPITAGLPPGTVIPGYTANVQGRLAATPQHLEEIHKGAHVAFVYCSVDGLLLFSGSPDDLTPNPNQSALGAAALINKAGNVLAIMPHPERDGWNFNHPDRRIGDDILAPSGGAALFFEFREGGQRMSERAISIRLKIPDNEAYTALTALRALDVAVERIERSEIWLVEDAGEPATLAARVETNEAIFNPNKHRLTVLDATTPRQGEAWIYELPITGGEDPIARPTVGGKTIPGISKARRYVGWRLLDAAGAPVARRALESALERLLCNPAIEKALY